MMQQEMQRQALAQQRKMAGFGGENPYEVGYNEGSQK